MQINDGEQIVIVVNTNDDGHVVKSFNTNARLFVIIHNI